MKPAYEPIILARKPLSEANVAANVLKWGTGALNIDECRIVAECGVNLGGGSIGSTSEGWDRPWKHDEKAIRKYRERKTANIAKAELLGRWPANLILDEDAAAMLDEQSGKSTSNMSGYDWRVAGNNNPVHITRNIRSGQHFGDQGGASRFFYTAKADMEDRDGTKHPTVKPVDLMKWLITLVTPPGGLVLDPFMGSGPTVYAARDLGFRVIGIEQDPSYCRDAVRRLRQGILPL